MIDLYVFAISHYCEKSRWTLDHLGLDYSLHHLAPGAHAQVAKQLGAPGSSLPIVVSGEQVIQGSDAIFDWACEQEVGDGRSLAVAPELESAALEIERRLDERMGVQIRRYFYSEALVEYPDTVLPIFRKDLDPDAQKSITELWPVIRGVMIEGMDLGRDQWDEAREIIETELEWLDGLLDDGRDYLVGEKFSRVDMTAASLVAVAAQPPEHPTYSSMPIPPRASSDIASWSDRRSIAWTRALYRKHR